MSNENAQGIHNPLRDGRVYIAHVPNGFTLPEHSAYKTIHALLNSEPHKQHVVEVGYHKYVPISLLDQLVEQGLLARKTAEREQPFTARLIESGGNEKPFGLG